MKVFQPVCKLDMVAYLAKALVNVKCFLLVHLSENAY